MLYLLVTGSRTWDDSTYIWNVLGQLHLRHGAVEVHHGFCPEGGTDLIADAWGNAAAIQGANVQVVRHPMDRHQFGKAAGPIRNTAMVNIFKGFIAEGKAVACHAFHRNNSRGTSDCAYKALVAGIPTVTHVWNGDGPIRTVAEEQLALFQDAA